MTTKKDLAVLEKIFAAEIEGRLPYQSKARSMTALCERGLVAPMARKFGDDRFAVTVTGFQLTHRGRILYCESCK